MSQCKKRQKRPWRLVYSTSTKVIWQRRDIDSIIVRIEGSRYGNWSGMSYFGNWHFPVPEWRIYRLGPFSSRTAAIRGAQMDEGKPGRAVQQA